MDATTNALNWFEIPATDITRAKNFYEAIFGIELHQVEMMGMHMAMFPTDGMSGKVGGGLVQSEMHKPSTDGGVVYLNGNPDLTAVLDKVESAGGQVVLPKTHIDEETGYMAFFIDSEGNKVGLHSNT